ncbi:MAG: Tad domain-containing protein [Planctomycetota bacterium]
MNTAGTPLSRRFLTQRKSRRGQSLILVFFILVALGGVLALTFDFGFVLLARRQMQTGVDAAALEGLQHSTQMRESARDLLRLNFDDDLDVSQNDTTIGAGLASGLTTGDGFRNVTYDDGSLGTAGILANRSNYLYRPNGFELNTGNERHGDIVVGSYDGTDAQHDESADYQRSDFTASTGGDSVLVRMRRTHDPDALDEVDDVSSNGGGIPILLGHFSFLSATQSAEPFSIRRDGMTTRATSIAASRPMVCVFASSSAAVYPLLPFTILSDGVTDTWRDTPLVDLYTDDPDDTGVPPQDLQPLRCSIGIQVAGTATTAPIDPVGYVAVVDASGRIVGFRLFEATPALHRSDSARLQDAWPSLESLSESDRQAVRDANRDAGLDLGQAAALVRSMP